AIELLAVLGGKCSHGARPHDPTGPPARPIGPDRSDSQTGRAGADARPDRPGQPAPGPEEGPAPRDRPLGLPAQAIERPGDQGLGGNLGGTSWRASAPYGLDRWRAAHHAGFREQAPRGRAARRALAAALGAAPSPTIALRRSPRNR